MTELASPQRPSTEPPSPRSPGTSVQEYLDNDARPVPAVLRYDINEDLGTAPLDVERYISREFHDREVEKVWRKVWQFACREDHIPNPGDHVTYDIADDKLIIMRQPDGTIKALYNVCLHRGRALRQEGGRVSELRCPFHGFSWNIDGTMKNLPCAWDFPEIDPTNFPLPEAKVATWNGFVFVNQDPDAEPLEDFLGSMLNDWDRWDYTDRVVYSHFGGIVNCNWKVAGEAFIEGFHSLATHPQMMEWLGDENTQYDVITGENWSRQIVPQGVPSPTIANHISEQEVLDSYYETRAFYTQGKGRDLAVGDDGTPRVPSDSTARRELAAAMRSALAAQFGNDQDHWTDSELLDGIQYFVFPNFYVFAGPRTNAVYRFRPLGNDPDKCIAEVFLLAQQPADGSHPKPAAPRWLQPGETFSDIKEIGLLGPVFDQDMANMPFIQEGLKSMRAPGVQLARYQENRIRHYHQILDEWIARP
jgi:phenylpropionate dioxygenase-like ring-hydroxylating dioxygenase large terminal subunit